MKATRTKVVMLSCLSAGAVQANPDLRGGLDSRIQSIEDQQFSTTTKLSGEVIFGGAFGSAEDTGSLGEAALFSDRVRLNFDTSFSGEDRLRTRLQTDVEQDRNWLLNFNGAVGHTENQQEDLINEDESAFYSFGGRGIYTFKNGPLRVTAGLGANLTYYEDDVMRDGSDDQIGDYEGALALYYGVNESAEFWATLDAYQGGHRSVTRNFERGGINSEDYFWWDINAGANHRWDGRPLNDPGVNFASDFSWGGYRADESDSQDNSSHSFRQEVGYNFGDDRTIFIEGAYGERNWRRMNDYDAEWWRAGIGVRGPVCSCEHLVGGLKVGVESREYDGNSLNDDDQEEVYAEAYLTGQYEDLSLGIYADYGIQEFIGGGDSALDAVGIQLALQAIYAYNETNRIIATSNYTTYRWSDVVSDLPNDHWVRWACGLACEHDLNDRLTFGAGVSLVLLDNDSDDDTHVVGTVRTRFRF